MKLDDAYSPENKLTLVALRLAILEKAASKVGVLGFIWATVVLSGGFATALECVDFCFVMAILLVEGARIFSRGHELEGRQQTTWSPAEAGALSFRSGGSLESPNLQPCNIRFFNSSSMSHLLYWLHLFSANACVVLSSMRLAQQNYGDMAGADKSTKRNLRPALNIFYGLSLAEALIFLAKRAYLEWKLSCCLLFKQVSDESGLEHSVVRRFFYETYSRCINGSTFDGSKMDMVSFAEELLVSGSTDEQLIGAGIRLKFADKAIGRIRMSELEMVRLVRMLNWTSSGDKEIRTAAALVVSRLAGKKMNEISLTRITGTMESIASLLYNENYTSPEEIQNPEDRTEINQYHKFNFFGLFILMKLAKDSNNCVKIGETNDLIPKIIKFTTVIIPKLHHKNLIAHTDPEIQAAKRALKVLKRLASTTGRTGKTLRREITKNNITIDNIHEIVKHKGDDEILNPLRKLGVEIITYLAIDEAAREIIGVTEGMMRELVRIFLDCERLDGQVREKAGDALAMLVIESGENCERFRNAQDDAVSELLNEVGLLNEAGMLKKAGLLNKAGKGLNSEVGQNALRILTYLFAYGDPAPNFDTRMELIIAVPRAVRFIMYGTEKQQEASTGFMVQIVKCKTRYEYFHKVSRELPDRLPEPLVNILQKYKYPSITTPCMRRNVIELSICLMQLNKECITKFRNYGMEKELQGVAETTSYVECFVAFCGHVGIARCGTAMTTLIDTARELLREN